MKYKAFGMLFLVGVMLLATQANAWTISGGNLQWFGQQNGIYYPYTGYYNSMYPSYYSNPNRYNVPYWGYGSQYGNYGYGSYGSQYGGYGGYGNYGYGSQYGGYGGYGLGGYGGSYGFPYSQGYGGYPFGSQYGSYGGYGLGGLSQYGGYGYSPYSGGYGRSFGGGYGNYGLGSGGIRSYSFYPQASNYNYYGSGYMPSGYVPSWYYGYNPLVQRYWFGGY